MEKNRKQEQLPVAGRVSRVSRVSLWNWEEGSLQNSAKGKNFSGVTQGFWKKTLWNPRDLLSVTSFSSSQCIRFCAYIAVCGQNTISSKNIPHDHWKHTGNSWLRLYWEQSEYMNHLYFSDFLNAAAAHVSKAEDGKNCLSGSSLSV